MAKQGKKASGKGRTAGKDTSTSGAARTGNGFDPKLLTQFRDDIMRKHGDIRSIKAENAARCQSVQQDIAGYYDAARGSGIPKKLLKDIIEECEWERKLKEKEAKYDRDERETKEQMMLALGMLADTPLGQAAQQPPAKPKPPAKTPEQERIDENVVRLQGIKQTEPAH